MKTHSSCEIEDSCRNSYLQAVCDTPIARIVGCVSSLRIMWGSRLPLELQQCSFQGQQGDVSQSVRGNYKDRF